MPIRKSLEKILQDERELERILADPDFQLQLKILANTHNYDGNKVAEIVLGGQRMYREVREEEIKAEQIALEVTMTQDLIDKIKHEAGILYYYNYNLIASQNVEIDRKDLEGYTKIHAWTGYLGITREMVLEQLKIEEGYLHIDGIWIYGDGEKIIDKVRDRREIVYLHQNKILLSSLVTHGSESAASFLKFSDEQTETAWILVLSHELCEEVVGFIQKYPAKNSPMFSALFPDKTNLEPRVHGRIYLIDASNAPFVSKKTHTRLDDQDWMLLDDTDKECHKYRRLNECKDKVLHF